MDSLESQVIETEIFKEQVKLKIEGLGLSNEEYQHYDFAYKLRPECVREVNNRVTLFALRQLNNLMTIPVNQYSRLIDEHIDLEGSPTSSDESLLVLEGNLFMLETLNAYLEMIPKLGNP